MRWTEQHNLAFVSEMIALEPWIHKHGSPERGETWKKVADNLNALVYPCFKVSQRSVRDRYSLLERKHKSKVRAEERASGISPEESQLDEAMANIISQFEDFDQDHEKASSEKKKKAQEDIAKAEEMRHQSLETFKESHNRADNGEPAPKRKRASGSDALSYLRDAREQDMKERKKELEKQQQIQMEEMKLKRQAQEQKQKEREAMIMMQQQHFQLIMQQQQQQTTLMMNLMEKVLGSDRK